MKLTKIFAALSVFSIMAISASAQTTHRTDRSKIKQGVKSGELTKKETKTLVLQQRDIRRDVKDAREDGNVTAQERRHIKIDKKKADASIYRKKHNKRDRD
jgi:polyhydroxyalkanoate synthesis regulator phasin